MAENKEQLERNGFVRGFITEASPLTFPENASIDEENFVLNSDGYRQRRLGLDFEAGYFNSIVQGDSIDAVHSTTLWVNAGNNADRSILVIQSDSVLYFYDASVEPISNNFIGSVQVNNNSKSVSYASINGILRIVADGTFYALDIDDNDNITLSLLASLEVRDLIGVDDGLAYNERPATLSDEHHYNLLNQGWLDSQITDFFNSEGVYPSNADIASIGIKDDGSFDPSLILENYRGNSPAPKGKFIIDPFSPDRNALRSLQAGVTLTGFDTDGGKIDLITPYADRVFFSGSVSTDFNTSANSFAPNNTGTVFFTQILSGKNTPYNITYQLADPTASDIFELVATDGGSVRIAEAGKILHMEQIRESLLVMSSNGVWEISGPDDVFRADDYSVKKLTNFGTINRESVVVAEDKIFYWSEHGIVSIYFDGHTRSLAVRSMSETTIQKYYDNKITKTSKLKAVGGYDIKTKTVRWLYNELQEGSNGIRSMELIFDIRLEAFYKFNFPPAMPHLPPVLYLQTDLVNEPSRLKYLGRTVDFVGLSEFYNYTFLEYNNTKFKDYDTVDAKAYLLTGWEDFGETQRDKQLPYLTTHFTRTESGFTDDGNGNLSPINPSGCLISTQWDFADHINSNKWTSPFQAYRLLRRYIPTDVNDTFDYGHQLITTKNRVRGAGRVFSFKMETEEEKDCIILGWAMKVTGRTNV